PDPLTPEGKHAASANALKSGIYAEALIIPGERAQDLETLTAEYHHRWHPTTPEARDLVDSLVRHAWLLRRLAVAEAASFNCDCPGCADHYEGLSDTAIVSTRIKRKIPLFEAIQRRINATERNYHRSLKALQALPSPPEEPVQPEESKPTSAKLASFPENHPGPDPGPEPGPAGPPEMATPSCLPSPDFSKKLASFPQNDFLRDLRHSSVDSVKNPRPQTLETSPEEP